MHTQVWPGPRTSSMNRLTAPIVAGGGTGVTAVIPGICDEWSSPTTTPTWKVTDDPSMLGELSSST